MHILTMSAAGAVLIGVILLLRPLVVARLPNRTLLVLWGVALCRLLLPVSIASPLSVYNGVDALRQSIQAEAPAAPAAVHPGQPAVSSPPAVPPAAQGQASLPASPSLTWEQLLAVSLFAGTCLLALFLTAAYWRCLRKFSKALPLENPLLTRWQEIHPHPRVRFRQGGGISSPLTYGLFRPVILFPEHTDWADTAALEYILAHEYTHIRRRDAAWKLVLAAALCLHWFNPLVWVMYLFANRDLELACDEAVVQTFGIDSRPGYALSILRAEEARRVLLPLCSGFRRKSAIEERITAIMKTKRSSDAALAAAVLLVIGVTAAFATSRIHPPANRWDKAEVWVDYAAPGEDGPWGKTDQLSLPEFPDTSFHWSTGAVTAREGEQETTLIWGMPVWNTYLQDLNGDGLPEFCSTVSFGSGMIDNHIMVYDYAAKTPYVLWDRGVYDYVLSLEDGVLQAIQSEYNGAILSTKPLSMDMLTTDGRLEDFTAPKPEEDLPVNRRGETYGDGFSDPADLIASTATNGAEGYVRSADLTYDGYTGPLTTEEDFAAYQAWQETQPSFFCVPVYDLDRDHVVGWFDVGIYDESPLSLEHQTIILNTAAALLRQGSDLSEAEIAQAREGLAAERGWPKPGPEVQNANPDPAPATSPAFADIPPAPKNMSVVSADRWDDLVIPPYPEKSEIPVANMEEAQALIDCLKRSGVSSKETWAPSPIPAPVRCMYRSTMTNPMKWNSSDRSFPTAPTR